MLAAGAELRQILETSRPRILRQLRRHVDAHEAEDLAQQVLVRIAQRLGSYRGEASLATWIHRIAANVALDHVRARARGAPARPDVEEGQAASAESVAIRAEMNACVRQFVDGLPENDRIVIVLSELRELADKELAEALGVSLETAKMRLHRARRRLRDRLHSGCELYRDDQDRLACDRRPDPAPALPNR